MRIVIIESHPESVNEIKAAQSNGGATRERTASAGEVLLGPTAVEEAGSSPEEISSGSTSFAPPWLKCTGCIIAMLPFSILLGAVAVDPHRWCVLAAAPFAFVVFLAGLNTLISGRPQRAFLAMAASLLRGRLKAKYDDRTAARDDGAPKAGRSGPKWS